MPALRQNLESGAASTQGHSGNLHHRVMGGIIAAGLLLSLSACSMGDHGAPGHHGESKTGGDHHLSEPGGHGHDESEGEDHHEGLAGRPGMAADVTRTVEIDMSDAMVYTPASIEVNQGETIRFVVANSGQLNHEFVLGSADEIMEHHELMKRFPGMEHDEPNSVSLEAGGEGEVIWTFTSAGEVDFACLQPGHFEAGMKGKVRVEPV